MSAQENSVACAEALRVQAYFDAELDASGAAAVERHLLSCAECRALLADLAELRNTLRRDCAPAAPLPLRAALSRALDAEEARSRGARAPLPSPWRTRSFWLGAGSGIGGALAAGLLFVLLAPLAGTALLDDLVGAHLRSLTPAHLIAVESSDHHTVKPWFSGHTDVSPVVADFAADGFTLVGGRADALQRQRAAVLVYRHGAHVINVFSWEARHAALTREAARNGYHMVFWSDGDLQYCAVSDAGWDELRQLARLIQDQALRERPG
jgi:anti-sigma factor RsiW